ncbi:MAG: hypothetical protein CL792_05450 [Chloroflexi bacterium]|nr:hypothetical protein [Chloroflexota bacterium]|tara:strand:+ start:3808 stop:5139 length:1332 start_codon:yes stop_codon:yes gene_type:complete
MLNNTENNDFGSTEGNDGTLSKFLVAGLSIVIALLLLSVGFLGRVITEPSPVTDVIENAAPSGIDQSASNLLSSSASDVDFGLLGEILIILEDEYVEPERIESEYMHSAAINGMFEALDDPHTAYIPPSSFALSRDDFFGAFQGIGATVNKPIGSDFVEIVRPLPDSPAEAAGIKIGDVILEVDGDSAKGWSVEEAVLRIRGPQGSPVELLVRHLDGSEELIVVVRDEIKLPSVSTIPPGGKLVDKEGNEVDNIAYIRIYSFTRRTPTEIEALLKEVNAGQYIGIILDVRGNPGGLLTETTEIVDMFLDEGIIVIEVDRNRNEKIISASEGQSTDLPIVIIQDESSASGSELLAAALQENGRALVIGEPSFGKGTVNHVRELSNGGAVYVSIARWLTPDRNQIESRGVIPDIERKFTMEDIDAQKDVQAEEAIAVLQKQVENQ